MNRTSSKTSSGGINLYSGRHLADLQHIPTQTAGERKSNLYHVAHIQINSTCSKKDVTIRLCLDSRKLNDILLEDWELPEPAEILFQKC